MDSKYTLTYHGNPRSILEDVCPMLSDPGNERKSVTLFLDLEAVLYLKNIDLISTDEQSGNAPTTGEFISFMDEHHKTKFEMIANVSFLDDMTTPLFEMVGMSYQGDVTFEMAVSFVEWFRLAEVFSISKNNLYCMFD